MVQKNFKMKNFLILKETSATQVLDVLSKLKEKEELKLILHEKINFSYDEIRKIADLRKGLESNVQTFSLGNLDTKGFIFFVLCGSASRKISEFRCVNINEDPELIGFGIEHIAKNIYESTGKYSAKKFIKDYNDHAILDYAKLKKLGIISKNVSENSSRKKKTSKKAIPVRKANYSDAPENESMPKKSKGNDKKSKLKEVDTSNITVVDSEELTD